MNYNWTTIRSDKKDSKTYYGIFETAISGMKVKMYISVTPTLNELNKKRVCFEHIYFEALSNNISDSVFHSVNDDIYYLLGQTLNDKCNLSKTAIIECYCVKKIPDYVAFTGGDYSFEDLE